MWPTDFESRLRDWKDLRDRCGCLHDLQDRLATINDWWFRAPTVNHSLHWDRWQDWPNAWQLLHDDIYCDLARGLGMLYTVMMLDPRDDIAITLVQCDLGNLVLIEHGKYIMNWCPGDLLNIQSHPIAISKQLQAVQLEHLIG